MNISKSKSLLIGLFICLSPSLLLLCCCFIFQNFNNSRKENVISKPRRKRERFHLRYFSPRAFLSDFDSPIQALDENEERENKLSFPANLNANKRKKAFSKFKMGCFRNLPDYNTFLAKDCAQRNQIEQIKAANESQWLNWMLIPLPSWLLSPLPASSLSLCARSFVRVWLAGIMF